MWHAFILTAVLPVVLINLAGYIMGFKWRTDKFTDISYSLSFLTAVWSGVIIGDLQSDVHMLYAVLVSLWAVRLGSFLLYRILKMGRDERFDDMRDGAWSFAKFWILQTVSVLIIVCPFYLIDPDSSLTTLHGLWSGLFLGFWIWQAVADTQKLRAKSSGKGAPWELRGLWHKIRHPNYLGEIMMWTMLWLITLSAPTSLLGIISPLWISVLLLFISGIPLIESARTQQYGKVREYQEYLSSSWRLFPYLY